jgi:Ca2+-binding EF-hand superfamily protein
MFNEFSEDRTKEIREAFEMFDKDKDNMLDYTEAINLLSCIGYDISDAEVLEMFSELGTHNNTHDATQYRIDFGSMLSFLNKRNKEIDVEKELIYCFNNLDTDGDGVITAKEMKYIFYNMGEMLNEEEVEEIIRETDSSGIGAITYKDFIRIMMLK